MPPHAKLNASFAGRGACILKAYRDVPAADVGAVALVLVKLVQLAADAPESGNSVSTIAPVPAERRKGRGYPRFAVRSYPKESERELTLDNGRRVFVRPCVRKMRRQPFTMTMCSRRGPWAPRSRVCSISAERDGPVIMLTVRGISPLP